MPAQDPLSLFFLGCALFSALFLAATVILGAGHGHGGHIGAHTTGHVAGHVAGHSAGHTAGHVAAHNGATHTTQTAHTANGGQGDRALTGGEVNPLGGAWATAQGLLLGALNINGLLVFMLLFGLLGYLLHTGGTPTLFVLLLSALVGVIGAVLANAALAKLFFENEAGELTERSSQIEGRIATVSIAIRPGGIGEIIFPGEAGARQSMGARAENSSATIAVETEVVVTSVENGIATVQPWNILLEETKMRLLTDAARDQMTPPATPAS